MEGYSVVGRNVNAFSLLAGLSPLIVIVSELSYSAGHAKLTKMLVCEPKRFQKNKVQICVQGG